MERNVYLTKAKQKNNKINLSARDAAFGNFLDSVSPSNFLSFLPAKTNKDLKIESLEDRNLKKEKRKQQKAARKKNR